MADQRSLFPGSLVDVAGLKVGHFTDGRRPTGCTVVLCGSGAVAGVDVRGAAPGSRETDALHPLATLQTVHALLLTGGSAFGLAAADGVMRWLEEHGVGIEVGPARVPIVPAAVLFDLVVGDPAIRPDAAAGYAACAAASTAPPAQGSVGAGSGATVGKLFGFERVMKGGIGSASLRAGAATVAALVVVNAVGDVVDPDGGRVVAGARGEDGRTPLHTIAALRDGRLPRQLLDGAATTIGVVATDAALTKAQAAKLAAMAHDGLARSINPVHTAFDGDTMFALATGKTAATAHPAVLGALAAEVTARAVLNAVRSATGIAVPPIPSARDLGLA